jgi:hypothetical protein
VGENTLPGYGPVILMKRPVRSRTQGVVGAGGEKPPATRFINVCWFETKQLVDSHPASCHELKHEPVPGFQCSENRFIDCIFIKNGTLIRFGFSKKILGSRRLTRVSHFRKESINDQVEES